MAWSKITAMCHVSPVLGMRVTRDREERALNVGQEYQFVNSRQARGGGAVIMSTPGGGQELSVKQPMKVLDPAAKQQC